MTASLGKTLRLTPVVIAPSIGAGLVAGRGSSSSASEPSTTSAPPVRQAAGVSQEELRRRAKGAVEEFHKQGEAIQRQTTGAVDRTFDDRRP